MPDMIVASMTATKEEMEHAVSSTWREPFQETPVEVVTEPAPAEVETPEEETPATTEETPEVETDAAPEAEEEVQETDEPRPKGKGGFQKKIDKLTREKSELSTQLAEFRDRFKALEDRVAGKPAESETEKPKPETASAKGKPTPDEIGTKFKDYEDYNEALISWKAQDLLEKTLAARDQQAQEREQQEYKAEVAATYKKAAKEFEKQTPDFNEAVNAAIGAGMKMPEQLLDMVLELDNGPAVTYFLCKNPETTLGLIDLPIKQGFVELGRLSESLKRASAAPAPVKTPAKKPISSAPAPARPVAGHSARSTPNLSELSTDEFIKLRNRQEAERRN